MKVAIVYDRVNKFGGAERVLLSLNKMFPNAPLYTSLYDSQKAKWAKVFPKIYTSGLNRIKFLRDKHEFLAPIMPTVFSRFNFENYDLVISVTSEFAKNINTTNGTRHICYCLTPTRYLWSGYNDYFQNSFLRKLTKPIINYLKMVDLEASKKPDEMIAISTEVQKRIRKYYKRKSRIIFPPVGIESKKLKNLGKKNKKYFLLVSRLVKYKKVDLAIEVFNELNFPLIIIGEGKEERKLKNLANKNIIFLGAIDDKKLLQIYKQATALIFPQNEDFGIVAVEAQSQGIPVIAYNKGGAMDIVTEDTGIFFNRQNKKSLIEAIYRFQQTKFNKKVIKNNAKKFSEKKFKDEFLKYIHNM